MATERIKAPATMPVTELGELLNTLLEAERAGARVLAAFLDDYAPGTGARRQLAAVQHDEARNCAILIDLIQRVNATPSRTTGGFLHKALAIQGKAARLRFLNRGQRWVARRINDALPHIEQDFVCGALFAMQESHLLNIEACGVLAKKLEARSNGSSKEPTRNLMEVDDDRQKQSLSKPIEG